MKRKRLKIIAENTVILSLGQVKLEHLMGIPYDFTGPVEEYDVPTWPVILSSCHNETLQDGWNRFSMYCQLKMTIPVIWYPD